MLQNTLLITYLGIGAVMDGRKKRLGICYLWLGGILAVCFWAMEWIQGYPQPPLWSVVMRGIPGFLFLLCGWLTREKIGYGDGIILLILGACLTEIRLWVVWIGAVLILLFFSLLLFTLKKADRNTRIPFVPFLWIAYLFVLGMNYG